MYSEHRGIVRKSILGYFLIISITVVLALGISISALSKEVTVRIGIAMYCPPRAPEQYSEEHHLLEKYASEFGYDVKVERQEFLSGRDMVEAMVAGRLDIAGGGQTPALSIIATDAPIYLAGGVYTIGHEGHWLVVRPDGKIGTLDDLVEKNATIGVPIGSTAHMFLDFMFYAAYGKGVEDTGITLVDISVQDALLFPKGIDAIAIWGSTPFKLKEKGLGEILVSEKGDAGPAWTGAVEKGKVPFFKDSVFYPEGFQMTRGFGFVRKAFGDEYPDLVVAQMLAILESMKALDQSTEKGQELAWDYSQNWELSEDYVLEIFKIGLGWNGERLWNWLTEEDMKSLVWNAPWMHKVGALSRLITWEDIKEKFKWAAKVEKEAWERAGKYPNIDEFIREDAYPPRGYPLWMMDMWEFEPAPEF